MKKYLYLTAGFLTLGTGVVGIFIPVLPTTPFLLLAAACFLKSSKKLYTWLTVHKVFGKYIENYIKYKAVSRNSKIVSIAVLWAVLSISLFVSNSLHIKLFLAAVGIGVTCHLLLLKSLEKVLQKEKEVTLNEGELCETD
ncbi:MAG TPA: YbaN family protein [Treponemataceae bacterium]|nr:YbaN family protein [Treponemataceae bacterium]HQL05663.1 YbaN family protein [Treponemataceae bacterium]